MTTTEFSNQFEILYNNITSNQAPGLDEYEKSVILTQAQEEILEAFFNPKKNKILEGLGDSSRRDIDFSKVIIVKDYKNVLDCKRTNTSTSDFDTAGFDFHSNSKSFTLPDKILFTLDEFATVQRGTAPTKKSDGTYNPDTRKTVLLTVLPLNYSTYSRIQGSTYKRPMSYQAWRISYSKEEPVVSTTTQEVNTSPSEDTSTSTTYKYYNDLVVGPLDEIVSYKIRYVRRPRPIILESFSDGVTIEGESQEQTCELDEGLHLTILKRAVELAKAAFIGYTQENSNFGAIVASGNSSSTDLGIIPRSNN